MLGKDTKNNLTTESFYLNLAFDRHQVAGTCSNPAKFDSHQPEHTLESERQLWRLVRRHGTAVTFDKGDILLEENTTRRCLCFIEEGSVEGVCKDIHIDQYMHPLGRTASEAVSLGHRSERVPTITMCGSKSVIGVSPFLSDGNIMSYRAKGPVTAYELFRRVSDSVDTGRDSQKSTKSTC